MQAAGSQLRCSMDTVPVSAVQARALLLHGWSFVGLPWWKNKKRLCPCLLMSYCMALLVSAFGSISSCADVP